MSLLFPTEPLTPKAPKVIVDKAPDFSKALTATKGVATPFDNTWTKAQKKLGGRLQTQQPLIPGMEVGIAPVWSPYGNQNTGGGGGGNNRNDLVKTLTGGKPEQGGATIPLGGLPASNPHRNDSYATRFGTWRDHR